MKHLYCFGALMCMVLFISCNRPASTVDMPLVCGDSWALSEIKTCYETVHDAGIERVLSMKETGNVEPATKELRHLMICGDSALLWELHRDDRRSELYDAKTYPMAFFGSKGTPATDPETIFKNPKWACKKTMDGFECR